MQSEQKTGVWEPTTQSMHQINTHMHVMVQMDNFRLQPGKGLMQRCSILQIHFGAMLQR